MCHLIFFLPVFGLAVFWIFPFDIALPIYLLIVGISLFLYFKIFQAMRQAVKTGSEGMVGKKGLVVEDINPEGKILYASEIWDAHAGGTCFMKGDKVKICGMKGLKLIVEKLN